MTRKLFLCLSMIASMLLPATPANAAWLLYQTSPADTFNRPEMPAAYDITVINFGVSDTQPDEYWFVLNFANPGTSTLFSDGLGSFAGIFFDTNGDGKNDFSLRTNGTPYVGNFTHPAIALDHNSNESVTTSKCTADTWTNLDTKASWIAFSIKKNCMTFPSVIGIMGYSDHISNDNAEFDYAPANYWKMSVTGGAVSAPGNSASTIVTGQLPSVTTEGLVTTGSPANPPDDLVALAAETTKSVVTVLCGNSLGSGWSIHASLSSANIANGYKSYIITNHHVIADCKINRDIFIILANQVKVPAYVYSWDEANDVAGVMTATVIPTLEWRGFAPQQGWWAGVLGSPLGFPGVLTVGIVSSVNSTTFLGTTNAAINHGNSGGPVFDRQGRVLGLATAKYLDSEGFGIFNGAPLLCYKIVSCTGASQIWSSAADRAAAAAVDAAQEATDAANAFTDAANAAATDADSATIAALEASEVVSALSVQVDAVIADLKAQIEAQQAAIAALEKLIIKLQK